MADLDGLIDLIPIGDIAKKLGIDENVAKIAVQAAVPAIVGGLAANAKDAGGAKSLESALSNHVDKSTKIDDIDEADGKKIVNNVFGSQKDDVVAAVAAKSGGPDIGAIVQQVLPIIAPIVLSFIASQFLGGKKEESTAAAPAASGGGIGDLLGGLLGGSSSSSSGGIGDILGGLGSLLGGGKK